MKALAAHLGKPEIVKTCRLVQRLGENSAFSSFKALVVTFSPKTSSAHNVVVKSAAGFREVERPACIAGDGSAEFEDNEISRCKCLVPVLLIIAVQGQQVKKQKG